MPEDIKWLHFFNNVGGINNRYSIFNMPVEDATSCRNIDFETGGFKKSKGITRFVEAPLISSGTYMRGAIDPATESDPWTGAGDASTISFAAGIMTNDESAGATGFQRYFNAEAGFTTGVDAAVETRLKLRSGGTANGVYFYSPVVLDDATKRLELAFVTISSVTYIAVLTDTSDRTIAASYASASRFSHDWTAFTRIAVAFDGGANIDIYVDDLATAAITVTYASLPASTETSRVAFGSFNASTVVITDTDYLVYKTTQTTLATHTITGLFDFENKAGTHFQLMTAGTALYKYDSTTDDWAQITLGTAFTSGAKTFFQVSRDSTNASNCIITTSARDVVQDTNGTTAANLGGTPPQGRYIAVFNDRTWIANTSTEPTAVFFSGIGTSEGSDTAATWDTTNDVFVMDRDIFAEITGLAPIGGSPDSGNMLLVFLRKGIKRITGWGKSSFLVETVSAEHGCVAPRSIKRGMLGPRKAEGVYFRDVDGWYFTGGDQNSTIKISEKIQRSIDEDLNLSESDEDVAFLDKSRSLIGWSTPTGDATTPDDTYAFDFFHGGRQDQTGQSTLAESWRNFDYEMTAAAEYFSSPGLTDTVYGTTKGLVYIANSGDNFDGTGFTGSRETIWFDCGIPQYVKQFRYLVLYFKATGDFNVTTEWAINWSESYSNSKLINVAGDSFIIGTGVLGVDTLGATGAVVRRFSTDIVGNSIRLKFSNAGNEEPFTLYGFSLGYQVLDWMNDV